MTWYAFNIIAETSAKVADVKNPLTDLDGDNNITAADMIAYMHMDNLAVGGQKTALGMPYSVLVNSTNPLQPVPNNDSDHDVDVSSPATGSLLTGGKMTYVFSTGTCFPHNETITFVADFERVE